MSFVVKHRGAPATAFTFADYECPVHGRFEAQVERTAEGDAPDYIRCPRIIEHGCLFVVEPYPGSGCETRSWFEPGPCLQVCEWRISAPLAKVRAIEAVKGGWTKPERKTYVDTRELGEGQSLEDFREKRAAIREEERKKDVMRFARENFERPIGHD